MVRRATVGGFGTFLLLGIVASAYGPILPTWQARFGLSVAVSGLSIGALTAGAVSGGLLTAVLASRIPAARRLIVAVLLIAAGAIAVACAQMWVIMLAGSYAAGIGSGAVAATYQLLLSTEFGVRSGTVVAAANGAFGVGSVISPALLGIVSPTRYAVVFLVATCVALMMVPCVSAVPDLRRAVSPGVARPVTEWSVIAAFAALLCLEYGLEQSIGGWETTHLRATGTTAALAASAPALYWALFTVARLVGAPLMPRVRTVAIPTGALGATAGVLVLAAVPGLHLIAYTLSGVGLALVTPQVLVWFARRTNATPGVGALVLTSGSLGTVIWPVLIGVLIGWWGAGVVPFVCSAIALGGCVVSVALLRGERDRAHTFVAESDNAGT